MSDYDNFRPGGGLKLKGVAEGGIVKKKKKKTKSSKKDADQDGPREAIVDQGPEPPSPQGSGRNSPAIASSSSNSKKTSSGGDRKTEAERRFEEVQRRRLAERVSKLARKTHKDRVNEFNSHLESLSEHHDIPKVGPG